MNKLKQKRHNAYKLGYEDGLAGRVRRYTRHPFFKAYKSGWQNGHIRMRVREGLDEEV